MFVLENTEYVTHYTRNDNQILLTDDNRKIVFDSQVKQVMVIGKEKNKIEAFKEIVKNNYKMNILDSPKENSDETWFSIISANASKGVAVLKLAKHLNIPLENIIAIGNDNNDISMFEVAKISAAVSNSTKEALEKATYEIKSNDEDGVAFFLETLIK